MREILFRGKRVDNGEWVYGFLTTQFRKYSDGILISKIQSKIFGYGEPCVETETVGQYTGLTDINGTKIFEGDIVRLTDKYSDCESVAFIEFGNPNGFYSWGWQLVKISGSDINLDILVWIESEETGAYIEVIGNIHDNPKLLKDGEQE